MKIDCTTCKYGYEDERLGIPMCHHPKRFSEDCVDFNMYEEKESKESKKSISKDLEKAAEEFSFISEGVDLKGVAYKDYDLGKLDGFKAGAEWQKEQDNNFERFKDYTDKALISLEEAREQGRQEMKEQMLKDAVEGYVTFNYDAQKEGLPCATVIANEKPLEFYESRGFKLGDKIKLIIIKNDGKSD